jgi:hypothetical protein
MEEFESAFKRLNREAESPAGELVKLTVTHEQALRVLGLEPLTAETVMAVTRYYLSKHHPDKGGDAEVFKEVSLCSTYLRSKYE